MQQQNSILGRIIKQLGFCACFPGMHGFLDDFVVVAIKNFMETSTMRAVGGSKISLHTVLCIWDDKQIHEFK